MYKSLLIVFLLVAIMGMYAVDQQVIDNPKPNFIEKKYIELRKFREIGTDLGKECMFNVFSLTMDGEGQIYAYDNYQGKVFKFDPDFKFLKSFGKHGVNRGEFSGTWKSHPVEIKAGDDGFLYANDSRVKKVLKFNREGKFVDEFSYDLKNTFFTPFADLNGSLYFPEYKANGIIFRNQFKKVIFTVSVSPDAFKYLLFKPDDRVSEFLPGWEMESDSNDKKFLYLRSSSTLIVTKKGKKIKEYKIIPQEALDNYRTKVKKATKEPKKLGYIFLFPNMCKDCDSPESVLFQIGMNEKKGYVCTLYQTDSTGQLKGTYVVKLDGTAFFPHFYFKSKNIFYSLEDGKIYLYKEEK